MSPVGSGQGKETMMNLLIDIDVPDLNQGISFYCKAFGLTLNRRLDSDVAELVGGSSVLYLLQKGAGTQAAHTASAPRDYSRHWTPVHIDFVVDDLEQAAAQAIAAGAIRETEVVEWRGSRCITFSDPFGNGFCLIEFEQNTYRSDPGPD